MNSNGRNPSLESTMISSELSSGNTIHDHSSSFTRVLRQMSGTQNLSAQLEPYYFLFTVHDLLHRDLFLIWILRSKHIYYLY